MFPKGVDTSIVTPGIPEEAGRGAQDAEGEKVKPDKIYTVQYRMDRTDDWTETGIRVSAQNLLWAWSNYRRSHGIKYVYVTRNVEVRS